MKLLNHTLSYLSVTFLVVIGVWASFLYFNMLDEIYDSIDDGLENSKILIIQKAQTDSTILHKTNFMESNYAIHEITVTRAHTLHDTYVDSAFYMLNEEDYEPVRILKTAFRVQDRYYELHVASSMVEEDDLIEDLSWSLLWLYVILLVSILVINNFLLQRIWKPFYQIIERLKHFSLESSENLPSPQTKVTEFQILNDSVTALLDRTIVAFNSQKQFIENASHELQTPLAVSINKLELLAEKESMSEAEMEEITSIIQSLERLTRLNKTLLLLSRIENRQFPEQTNVILNEVVNRIVSDLEDLAEYKSVKIEVIQRATLSRAMNAELASIMIANLVKNAIIHNIEKGSVTISITFDSIVVENKGSNSPLDPSNIFKRFYKNSTANTSTGLGLAIVKSIVDYYGFSINYTFTGKHVFSITMNSSGSL